MEPVTQRTRAVPEQVTDFDLLPDSARVRSSVVRMLAGYSEATLWRRIRDGKWPPGQRDAGGHRLWTVGEIRAALAGGA